MANFENNLNVHDEAPVANWISQINAGGTVYDIATHHSIKFVEGGEETTWNGLSDLTVVIPTIQDIVQTPIEFAGTVDANGDITWVEGHTAAEVGSLVFVTADCTFNGIACEAGDMAIYDGKKWNVVSGENQVEIVGTIDGENRATVALGCAAKDVLTVEGKSLALALDYEDLKKHLKVTKGYGDVESVVFGDVTVSGVGLKLEKAADVPTTIGADKDFENATALADGTVGFNVSKVVTSVDFGTFNAGAFPEAKRNTAKDFAVTGGSLTAGAGSDFVTDVTLGEIKLVEAGAGDADKITVLSGITSGVGASFLNGIALTKDGETADLTIAGAYVPTNGVNTTFVEGLEEGSKVLTGYTAGSFTLAGGATEVVTGFAEGSDEVLGGVDVQVNNDTSVLNTATVEDHVLSFGTTKVASSVSVTPQTKKLELSKAAYDYKPTTFTESGFKTSGFTQQAAINYTFGRANETVYTPDTAMWKVSTAAPTVSKGAYTINRGDMKVTVGAGVFVEDVTGGTLPSWTGGVASDMTLEGSVGTALTTETVTIKQLTVDSIDLPGAYSLKTATEGADVTVGAAGVGAATIGNSTIDLSKYITSVDVAITSDEVVTA